MEVAGAGTCVFFLVGTSQTSNPAACPSLSPSPGSRVCAHRHARDTTMDALPACSGSAGGGGGPAAPGPAPAPAVDADDAPPGSRLFFVVPRSADAAALATALAAMPGFQRADTAHVSTKGVAFAKFARASHALAALEAVADAGGVLAGHRVKCLVAAPRGGGGGGGGGPAGGSAAGGC